MTFVDDAIVVDEGTTYRGTKQIRAWQGNDALPVAVSVEPEVA